MASRRGLELGMLDPIGGGDPIPLLKPHLRVGRRESCDICLRFANVSSEHCELLLEHGYWTVRDLGSKNGIKVNGERVPEKRLYPGDEVCISKHKFRIQYTPTTARSADAEVDELHEDIMRFSLLERAGLAKQKDRKGKGKPTGGDKTKSDEDIAAAYLGGSAIRPVPGSDRLDLQSPALSGIGAEPEESQVEAISPSTSAVDLSDDEFLQLVEEDKKRKERERQNVSQGGSESKS